MTCTFSLLSYIMTTCTAIGPYPCSYAGKRLGITASVLRTDETHAQFSVRAGVVHIASGRACIDERGLLAMDEKSTRALRNRGVTMVSVSPAHDYIDVRADVRLIGTISLRLVPKHGTES